MIMKAMRLSWMTNAGMINKGHEVVLDDNKGSPDE